MGTKTTATLSWDLIWVTLYDSKELCVWRDILAKLEPSELNWVKQRFSSKERLALFQVGLDLARRKPVATERVFNPADDPKKELLIMTLGAICRDAQWRGTIPALCHFIYRSDIEAIMDSLDRELQIAETSGSSEEVKNPLRRAIARLHDQKRHTHNW